ncbi:uncharacterized protein C1orf167 homolog isoform X3 [Mesocricetus auratus]|uniref:Uncharacterized protein C1orf167 homolog isoform X3 n=1 Tax=Mesocricetus auratus TaxID=10036 RepID=A0ABM2WP31_MESAU|nr:uncharacterized protein C1orf167 homolog isoform X3 [Mesocricetus auratus]
MYARPVPHPELHPTPTHLIECTAVPQPMEPRPAARCKENVAPKTPTVLGPELKRPRRNLDIGLGSRGGRRMPMCQAATRSQGSVLCQKPYQVQSNLTSPCPRPALALKATTGQLGDAGLWQQSNIQLPAGRSQSRAREPFAQQSNLCFRGTTSPRLCNSCLPPTGPSSYQRRTLQAMDTPSLDLRLCGALAPLDGGSRPGPRPWCGSGSWASRLVEEPLTLEDLSVPAHSQSWVPSRSLCSADHWLLDSIQHLDPEATGSRSPACQEHPGPTQRRAHTRGGQPAPTQPWPHHPGERINLLGTLGTQARLSESPVNQPLFHEATLGTLAGDFSNSYQEALSTQHLGARERDSPDLPSNKRNKGHFRVTREAGSREARFESPTFFSVLPRQAGREKTPQEKAVRDGERMASCPSNTAPDQSALQSKAQSVGTSDPQAACQKLLSRSFRAWRRLSQRHQAAAKALALSLRLLRWAREARLEAAWGQHAEALLAWSFREERRVALQQKQELPHTQAVSPFLASRGSPSLGRKAATDLAWKCRCFRAWQRFVQRGARCRRHLAHRRVRVLRICLGQWVEMKQLQASNVTKVSQLALYRRKAGNKALSILVPGTATSHCLETVVQAQQLPKESDPCSLWEACQRLALHRVLLLWRTRLYQHQQAFSFLQGMQKRALHQVLNQWRLRGWGPAPPSSRVEALLALQPWTNSLRGEAWLGCRTSGESLEKVRAQQTQGAVRLYWHTLQRRYFQAWCERVRDIGVSQDHRQAIQDDLGGDLGATLANSQEACRAGPQTQDRWMTQASVLGWRSFLQECGAAGPPPRRAQARQAFVVWRVALGQYREAQQQAGRRAQVLSPVQVALCWVLWMHDSYLGQVHQAHAAQQLTSRVLEVWMQLAAQAHVHRADVTHCWWRLQCLLRTRWVQWPSTPLRWRLEPQTQAQGMDFRYWLTLASRGCLLQLDTPNFLIQIHGCGTHNVLSCPAWQHGRGIQRTTSCVLSDTERPLHLTFQFWLPLPARARPSTGLELCSSGARAIQGYREALQRNRHLQCRHIQASQQARCLARAWQRWVDVHWVEQLSRSLVGRLSSSSLPCRGPGSNFSHSSHSLVQSLGDGTQEPLSVCQHFLDDGPLSPPFHPGVAEVEGPGLPGQRDVVSCTNSLCSTDNGTWNRPGGHGGKRSFSCRWLSGCTSKKRAGSSPRPLKSGTSAW